MTELGWEEAIQTVLRASDDAMHYKAIAEEIAKQELRSSLGATPANTVNSYINTSINNMSEDSPYVRTGRGYYYLRALQDGQLAMADNKPPTDSQPSGVVQSLGMYWRSSEVVWKSNPKLLGQQQSGSDAVDFRGQTGVYLLHDRERVIYVGRSIDRPMGQRLFEHTKDRLNGRWDRFSWFGLKSVDDSGALNDVDLSGNGEGEIISTIEAVLIEALEPPQNRRRGDQLSAIEYLQVPDPDRDKQKIDAITALISGSLNNG